MATTMFAKCMICLCLISLATSAPPEKILNEQQILEIILRVETGIRNDFRGEKQELRRTIEKLTGSLKKLKSEYDELTLGNTLVKRELGELKQKCGKIPNISRSEIDSLKSSMAIMLTDFTKVKSDLSSATIQAEINQIVDVSNRNRQRIANLSRQLDIGRNFHPQGGSDDVTGMSARLTSLASDLNMLKIAEMNYESKVDHIIRNGAHGSQRKAGKT